MTRLPSILLLCAAIIGGGWSALAAQYQSQSGHIVTQRDGRPTVITSPEGIRVHLRASATAAEFAIFGYAPYTPPSPEPVEPAEPPPTDPVIVAAARRIVATFGKMEIAVPATIDAALGLIAQLPEDAKSNRAITAVMAAYIRIQARGGSWDHVVAQIPEPEPEPAP